MAIIFQALGAATTPLTSLCRCRCHDPLVITLRQEIGCDCHSVTPCAVVLDLLGDNPEDPKVEAAIGRAPRLLEALGITPDAEGDWSGELPAEDFLGRVVLALALEPEDEGIPAHEEGSGRWTDYGRSSGWLQGKLRALHQLAEFALAGGHPIAWG